MPAERRFPPPRTVDVESPWEARTNVRKMETLRSSTLPDLQAQINEWRCIHPDAIDVEIGLPVDTEFRIQQRPSSPQKIPNRFRTAITFDDGK
jgi:hypothetical protein